MTTAGFSPVPGVLLVTEEQVLKTASDRLEPYAKVAPDLRKHLPVDVSFASAETLKDLPAAATLAGLVPVLYQLDTDLDAAAAAIEQAVERAKQGIEAVGAVWGQRRNEVERAYGNMESETATLITVTEKAVRKARVPSARGPEERPHRQGSTLDFKDALLGGGLKMYNPQAVRECSCGESFSV